MPKSTEIKMEILRSGRMALSGTTSLAERKGICALISRELRSFGMVLASPRGTACSWRVQESFRRTLSRCKVPEPEGRHPRRFELSVLEPELALMISPKAKIVGLSRRRDRNLNRRHRHSCKHGRVSVREWLQRGCRHVGQPARSHWPDCGPVPSKAGSQR
jgi:hypothetical protein